MSAVLTFVLAGGRGERLHPLTRDRAKPAVPFAGLYRIIDFTLSNCLHSGLRHIFVLTQYKSLSLERHIHLGWSLFSSALGEFLITVPPQQRTTDHWYLGTADAIYQNWYSVERFAMERGPPEAVLVLAGDHVYKMDYRAMLDFHRERNADLTVGVLSVPLPDAANRLGVLVVDAQARVREFQEKPVQPAPSPDNPRTCLASMGIYAFRPEALARRLEEDSRIPNSSHDFGKDVINRMVGEDRVFAFSFERGNRNTVAYWRDVGTLDAYWEAHMDLVSITPLFNLYDQDWPIHTHHEPWPPAKTVHEEPGRTGTAISSLISPGGIISGSTVVRSVLSPGVRVNSFATVEESVLLSGVDVGRGAKVRRAIVDKGVRIPPGETIGYDLAADRTRFTVSEAGIVVIPKEARF
jgi:glucose-1-phosphate adenylyltransferase